MILKKGEILIVGKWIKKGNSLIQDSECIRIQRIIDNCFKQIDVNGNSWSALYENPDDSSYWELTYPQSHMHGGGPPRLEHISKLEASDRYKITE